MARPKSRGDRLPRNYVKITIMLFVGDNTVSGSDIRDYLKKEYYISEARGIRKHLTELCNVGYLDKLTRKGITNYYKWKHDLDSFKKIINLFSNNPQLIKKIMIRKFKKINTVSEKYNINTLFKPNPRDFDPTRYWYNTSYTKSFFTNKILNDILENAYQDYLKNKHKYQLNKSEFKIIIFEGHDEKTIVTLMHYSPNLVRYIIDLANTYRQKISDLKKKTDKIFFTVLHDLLFGNYSNHNGFGFVNTPKISKKFENDVFSGLEMQLGCSLSAPEIQSSPIKGWKKGRKI